MIFSTIIRDSYCDDERRELAAALGAICAPDNTSVFASQVIYCYWDFETHQPLYLGLAVNAAVRFEQHNALRSAPAGSNKRDEIAQYFTQRERIGFSIMVTHSNHQIANADARASNLALMVQPGDEYMLDGYDDEARSALHLMEGTMIEAGRLRDSLPWNKIGGSKAGAASVTDTSPAALDLLTGRTDSLYVARRSIREIADNYRFEQREEDLDTCRSNAQLFRRQGGGATDLDVWHYLTCDEDGWPMRFRPMMLDLVFESEYLTSVAGPRHCDRCVIARPR